jgi:hypothetical protein
MKEYSTEEAFAIVKAEFKKVGPDNPLEDELAIKLLEQLENTLSVNDFAKMFGPLAFELVIDDISKRESTPSYTDDKTFEDIKSNK